MLKIFTTIFFLFLLLFLVPKTYAWKQDSVGEGKYNGVKFHVSAWNDAYPEPEFDRVVDDPENSKIHIDITATNIADGKPAAIFGPDEVYYINFIDTKGVECAEDLAGTLPPRKFRVSTTGFRVTPTALQFETNTQGNGSIVSSCHLSPNTYTLVLFSKTESSNWVRFAFPVEAIAGGERTKIDYLNGNDLLCKLPNHPLGNVVLLNAANTTVYRLWWSNDKLNYVYNQKPATDSPTQIIPLNFPENDFRAGSSPRLCLAEGESDRTPALSINGCDTGGTGRSLVFKVTSDEEKCKAIQNAPPACKATPIIAEINTTEKKISIAGSHFPKDSSSLWVDIINTSKPDDPPIKPPVQINAELRSVTVDTGVLPPGKYKYQFFYQDADAAINKIECGEDTFLVSDTIGTGADGPNGTEKIPLWCDKDKRDECARQPTDEAGQPVTPGTMICSEKEHKCVKATSSSGISCNYDKNNPNPDTGIQTVIGCVPTDFNTLLSVLMKYAVRISGSIALLMMIFGSFQMITSQGNAEALKNGRGQFVSAVIGLLFVIFSTLAMEIIGIDILGLPGINR